MIKISPKESETINRLRFICLLIVVMIHSAAYKQPEAIAQFSGEALQAAANWHELFHTPPSLKILFLLSGYLFFRHIGDCWNWKRDYLGKMASRLTALGLPYVIWSGVSVAHNMLLSKITWGDLTFSYLLHALWPLDPMASPAAGVFWFIRSLICFTLLSPLYYLIYKYCRHFTFLIAALLIFSPLPMRYMYGNAYLLLGGYLAYSGITLTRLCELFPAKFSLLPALVLSVIKCFHPEWLPFPHEAVSAVLLMLWLPALVGLSSSIRLPSFCSPAAGMFLYAAHCAVCSYISARCIRFLPNNLPMLVADLWITMICATIICLLVFAIVRKIPYASYLLTGGRS